MIVSSLLPCLYAVQVYCNEVMRLLGYGSKTGRYVDTCGRKCPCVSRYGLGSIHS